MRQFSIFKTFAACALSSFIATTAMADAWKFGVMSDTQWPNSPDGKNPNVAVNVVRHLNQEFVNKGVKFVIQVGDLTDGGTNAQLDTRATFAQDLYNAGIGFYPLRGNHESSKAGALEFQRIFPQTQTGVNNQTPADAMVSTTIYGAQPNSNGTFTIGSNFASEPGFEGLTYSFDYNNARFVFADQFTRPSGTAHANLDQTDINWIGGRFTDLNRPAHAFSFAHKGLITENHNDNLFNSTNPDTASATTWPLTNSFMSYLANNGVRYHLGGHDHMHNRAIVTSPDSLSRVQNIIAASDSYKFYIPPTTTTLATQTWRSREQQIAQELFAVGYYIFTVDGPKVTVDYYASPNGCNGDCDETNDVIPYDFTKHETFGYSLNGKEIVVPEGGSYVLTDDTAKAVANGESGYLGTTAAILSGTSGGTASDYDKRALTKTVDTGWAPATAGHASDMFTLWGMADSLATNFTDTSNLNYNYKYVVPDTTHTDTFTLSMSYAPSSVTAAQLQNGLFGLATKAANGNFVNALNGNNGGALKFVQGPWDPSYGLGTYGVDTDTNTAWAVINHASDFAVAPFTLTDISSSVTTKVSGSVYNRATQIYTASITITNNSTATISGPIAVTLNSLNAGVTLANATGLNNGSPYVAQVVSLSPGASASVPVQFRNPSNQRLNFTITTSQI